MLIEAVENYLCWRTAMDPMLFIVAGYLINFANDDFDCGVVEIVIV